MSPDPDRETLARQIEYLSGAVSRADEDIERLRHDTPMMVTTAVRAAMEDHILLTQDEQRSLKLLIKRQEQNIAFRQSVIEKSLTSLVWAAVVGAAMMVREYAIAHGMWRP